MSRRLSRQVSWPKGHAKVLLEAVEGLELVIAAIAAYAMPEGVQGQVVEQLGENEFARIHGAIRINGELQHFRLK